MASDRGDFNCSNYLKQLTDLVNSGNFVEARRSIQTEIFVQCVENLSSEMITTFAKNINENNYKNNQDLFHCCEDIICRISGIGDANEILLEFIEQAEGYDDALFCVMLSALKTTLFRIIDNIGYRLSWCFNTIIRHVSSMELKEDFKLEGEEYILLENTDSSLKLVDVYNCILNFSKPFSDKISTWTESNCSEVEELRNSFLSFLLKLLGRPLVYMNLEVIKIKGDFRLIAEQIFDEILKFKIDMLSFLNYVSIYNLKKTESPSDVTDVEYSNVSLAVFYYLIFKEKLFLHNISHVYNPSFIFNMLMNLSLELLNLMHSAVQYKGLNLFQATLERVTDFSLEFSNKRSSPFGEICESLCKIMIYSEVKRNRLISISLFKSFLMKFNSQGRFIILLNIQDKVHSPNFIGYIIPLTKDLVIKALNEKNPGDLEYFTGQNLRNLLKKFCFLNQGTESDLIELSDQIVSALNILRFLFIRDKDNITGIYDFIPFAQNNFLEPLKMGLNLSVAHYRLQMAEFNNAAPGEEVNISVAGTELPSISKNQKLEILQKSLSTFDLLESLRVRTQECLEEFKNHHSAKT